jgi:hypothetical protein
LLLIVQQVQRHAAKHQDKLALLASLEQFRKAITSKIDAKDYRDAKRKILFLAHPDHSKCEAWFANIIFGQHVTPWTEQAKAVFNRDHTELVDPATLMYSPDLKEWINIHVPNHPINQKSPNSPENITDGWSDEASDSDNGGPCPTPYTTSPIYMPVTARVQQQVRQSERDWPRTSAQLAHKDEQRIARRKRREEAKSNRRLKASTLKQRMLYAFETEQIQECDSVQTRLCDSVQARCSPILSGDSFERGQYSRLAKLKIKNSFNTKTSQSSLLCIPIQVKDELPAIAKFDRNQYVYTCFLVLQLSSQKIILVDHASMLGDVYYLLKFITNVVADAKFEWLLKTIVRAVQDINITNAESEEAKESESSPEAARGKMTLKFKRLCGLANCEFVIDFIENNNKTTKKKSYRYQKIKKDNADTLIADACPRAPQPLYPIVDTALQPRAFRDAQYEKLIDLNRTHPSTSRRQKQGRW